jgi:hypothetical protein
VLGIDVSLPLGWSKIPNHEFDATFAGPVQNGYRPMLAMVRERFEPPTPAGLSQGIDAIRAQQAEDYPGFELVAEQAIEVDGRAAYLEHFRWDGDGVPTTQTLALVVIEPGWVLKVDGACLTLLENEHLPLLDSIVTSIEVPRAKVSAA